MKKITPFLLIFLFLTFLIKIDHSFLKKNHLFCLHYIYPSSSSLFKAVKKERHNFPPELTSQKFTYLNKGLQSFVFESEDKKYVIKFYKLPSHMRLFPWIKRPFSYQLSKNRLKIKKANEKKLSSSLNSYQIAFQDIPFETAMVYTHLNPNQSHSLPFFTLIDKKGNSYKIDPNPLCFFIQKKGEPLLPLLKKSIEEKDEKTSKKIILSLLELISTRCKKGISDLDYMGKDNYGWIENRAFHIDVGRFVRDPSVKLPENCKKEIRRITQDLSDVLEHNAPSLYDYFLSKIDNFSLRTTTS